MALWPDDRPVWTGSCPCQPFSSAGKQKGKADDRHLWPIWFRLIRESKPAIIFGEQVAAAITHGWWDDVAAGLEAEGYSCSAAVLPACSVGKPHKRDRLGFMGNAELPRPYGGEEFGFAREGKNEGRMQQFEGSDSPRLMANGAGERLEWSAGAELQGGGTRSSRRSSTMEHADLHECGGEERGSVREEKEISGVDRKKDGSARRISGTGGVTMADSNGIGQQGQREVGKPSNTEEGCVREAGEFIDDSARLEWIECPDGKFRPVKSGLRLLAHGVSSRVGKLRAYGNAIVPQVAAEFIKSTM
jgi:DNA (cytosine-5)-methyltransferase 1